MICLKVWGWGPVCGEPVRRGQDQKKLGNQAVFAVLTLAILSDVVYNQGATQTEYFAPENRGCIFTIW